MALNVSSIVNAVNSYLYSISDVNKALTEESSSTQASGLAGLFQKFLNKAVTDANETAVKDIDVSSALQSMSSSSSDSDNNSTSSFDVTLPGILGSTSSVSFDDASADAILAKALAISSGSSATATGADSAGSLVGERNSLDALGIRSEIENNINNHNLALNLSETFENMDIKGMIDESIAEHNRLDEISSYNASRLSAYKNSSAKATDSSVFGDFRL